MATTASENWLIEVELSLSTIHEANYVNGFITYLQEQSFEDDLDAVIEDIKNEGDSYIVDHMQSLYNESDQNKPRTMKFVQSLKIAISKRNDGNQSEININTDKRPSNSSINTVTTNTITNSMKTRSTMYSTQTNQSTTTSSVIESQSKSPQIVPGEKESNQPEKSGTSMHKAESMRSMSEVSLDLDQEMLTDVLDECDDFKSDLPISYHNNERDPYKSRGNVVTDPVSHNDEISLIERNGKRLIKQTGPVLNDTKEINPFSECDEFESDAPATDTQGYLNYDGDIETEEEVPNETEDSMMMDHDKEYFHRLILKYIFFSKLCILIQHKIKQHENESSFDASGLITQYGTNGENHSNTNQKNSENNKNNDSDNGSNNNADDNNGDSNNHSNGYNGSNGDDGDKHNDKNNKDLNKVDDIKEEEEDDEEDEDEDEEKKVDEDQEQLIDDWFKSNNSMEFNLQHKGQSWIEEEQVMDDHLLQILENVDNYNDDAIFEKLTSISPKTMPSLEEAVNRVQNNFTKLYSRFQAVKSCRSQLKFSSSKPEPKRQSPLSNKPKLRHRNSSNKKKKQKPHIYELCDFRMAKKLHGIDQALTDKVDGIIPSRINENISDIFRYMIQSISLEFCIAGNEHQKYRVFDFNITDKANGQQLYCYAEWNGTKYQMKQQLFTESELYDNYKININEYKLRKEDEILRISNSINTISHRLNQVKSEVINKTKNWCKLAKQMSEEYIYNKKRKMELSLVKEEFQSECLKSFENDTLNNSINLIPIMIYDQNRIKHHIEYIWIIRIQTDPFPIDIGISIQYSSKTANNIMVKGIHLNKDLLIYRHQLVPYRVCNQSKSGCTCFNNYQCPITNLNIGNVDEDKNRINDLKNKLNIEQEKNKDAEFKISNLNLEITDLKQQNRNLAAKLALKNTNTHKSNCSTVSTATYGHNLNPSITSTILSDSCDIDENNGKYQTYSSDTISSAQVIDQ